MAAAMTQAKRRHTRRRVIQVIVLAAVVLLGLFIFSLVSGDDDGDEVAVGEDETSDTSASTTTTSLELSPVGEEVLERDPPDPEPPPEDLEAGALETETLIEGQGEGAAAGDTVTVHYIGKTADGNVFDQSWERGEPFTLPGPLGQGSVIAGWDQGLIGAQEGERLRLDIGADNAYGETGSPPAIPPNAPLAFVVDVVDIAPGAESDTTTTTAGSDG
jgi:FKBP-type peptidyl-prolyl cis-trans isomerase